MNPQARDMIVEVRSNKSVADAAAALEAAIVARQFGVMHVHNLQATMASKGVAFDRDVRVLEVCNPHKAKAVLSEELLMNVALPCRVSVYQADDGTRIAMMRPEAMLAMLSDKPALRDIAREVEATLLAAMHDAA